MKKEGNFHQTLCPHGRERRRTRVLCPSSLLGSAEDRKGTGRYDALVKQFDWVGRVTKPVVRAGSLQ